MDVCCDGLLRILLGCLVFGFSVAITWIIYDILRNYDKAMRKWLRDNKGV
jgi:hypothetical protein